MSTLAVIPARGGSQAIPRKNMLPLCGTPLVAHSILQAIQSETVDRVVVSTDDPEIAKIAQEYGSEVIIRPSSISGCAASSESALLHVLEQLQATERQSPDILVFLQCTSPLTLAEDIDGTVRTMIRNQADSALSVAPFHYFLWQVNENGIAEGINHDKAYRPLRQDREPQYIETGAVYSMRVAGFLHHKHRFFGKTSLYCMPPERVGEIDNPVDFFIVESLMREENKRHLQKHLPNYIQALVYDFDGVFTDNHVIVSQNDIESVVCSRADGMGIARLQDKTTIQIVVISKEYNSVVATRCKKLNIEYHQGIDQKASFLSDWLKTNNISCENTIYVGNDINDIECMQMVGCGIAVADAYPEVSAAAKIVLSNNGGSGAIRELCDLILSSDSQYTSSKV